MLAKLWKKVLLAVCIIACIFNVMSKIVNRHSLESNLNSVNDGNTIIDSIVATDEKKSINEVKSEEVANEEENTESDSNNTTNNRYEENNQEENNAESENKSSLYKIPDFIVTF